MSEMKEKQNIGMKIAQLNYIRTFDQSVDAFTRCV